MLSLVVSLVVLSGGAVFLYNVQASVLCVCGPLYFFIFAVCCNGKIPDLKFRQALANLHAISPIYHTGDIAEIFFPNAGLQSFYIGSHFCL